MDDIVADILTNTASSSRWQRGRGFRIDRRCAGCGETALARLFQEFSVTDFAGWSRVVARVQQGDPNSLEAVGNTGEADKHPAAGTLLTYVGSSGKKVAIAQPIHGTWVRVAARCRRRAPARTPERGLS